MAANTKYCLACLDTNDIFSIFETHECDGFGEIEASAKMIKKCFNIEIVPESEFNYICGVCMLKVRDAYSFKLEIIKNIQGFQQQACLQLEYLEHIETDIEQSNDAQSAVYEIQQIMDPQTGCMEYIAYDVHGNGVEIEKTKENYNIITPHELRDEQKGEYLAHNVHKNNVAKEKSEKITILDDCIIKQNQCTQLNKENRIPKEDNKYNKINDIKSNIKVYNESEESGKSKSVLIINGNTEDNIIDIKVGRNVEGNVTELNEISRTVTERRKGNVESKGVHHKSNQRVCAICKQSFPTTSSLRLHMTSHNSTVVCERCGVCFANANALRRHMSVHLEGPFVCTICDQLFDKLNTRNCHVWRVHRTSVPYVCSECGQRFKTFHQRLKHLQEDHGTEPMYPCPHCDKRFFYSGSRSTHVRQTHMRERRYKCSRCPMAFMNRRGILAHLASVHSIGEKRYQCSKCDKTFYRSTTLKYHMKTHETVRNTKYE